MVSFDKMCAKVSRLCGIHRKVVDLVVSGLVDMMAEDIDDGKTVQMGEFGLFRPTIKTKSADAADAVKASNILSKRIVFTPGKIFHRTLDEMSVTRSVPVDTDYTDGSSNGGAFIFIIHFTYFNFIYYFCKNNHNKQVYIWKKPKYIFQTYAPLPPLIF